MFFECAESKHLKSDKDIGQRNCFWMDNQITDFMTSNHHIREILKNRQLAPQKKLGQNFLVHRQTAEKIVRLAEVAPNDVIIELGVGLGSLTLPLASRAHQVIGLEIDAGIIALHEETHDLPANVILEHQDLLKADYTALADRAGGRLKIMANLPYSISNPLLFKLIENRKIMEWAVLMLQKEVGERLIAPVGSKEYGVLSVLMAGCASIRKIMDVGPGQFHPRPKVDSVVIRLNFHPQPEKIRLLPSHDQDLLKRLVKSAFQKRRKTLLNALTTASLLAFDKNAVLDALQAAGIDPQKRAENLTIEDYVNLTNVLARNP